MTTTLRAADAVFFDFNGTLSDDEGILRDIFIDLAAGLGVDLDEDGYRSDFAGRSDTEICQGILQRAGSEGEVGLDELLAEVVRRYGQAVAVTETISPGARELVRALSAGGVRLALVTGASRRTALPALERAGLHSVFEVLVTEEDVRLGKPDPEGLLLARGRLGLDGSARVVVFEDSMPGLEAVRAAGMIPVAVRGTHHDTDLLPRTATLVDGLSPDLLDLRLADPAPGDLLQEAR